MKEHTEATQLVPDYGTMASTDPTNSNHTWSGSESKPNDDPVTFADLGVRQENPTVDTYLGKRRPLSNLTHKEIAFVIVSFVAILTATGLTIERLINSDYDTSDITFAMVLQITLFFCLVYIVNGVIGERPYEIAVFVGGTLILMVYCIFNYVATVDGISPYEKNIKLARLVTIVAIGPICIVMGAMIARDYYLSRNLIFRTVGANLELQNLCSKIFFTEALLKVDLQLELSLVVLILQHGIHNITTLEIIVLSVGTFYAFVWFFLAFLAMRFENKPLTVFVLLTGIGEPAYIIYQLVDMGMSWKFFSKYMLIPAAIIIAGVLGLVVRILLCSFMIYIYRNYGMGMKEKAYGVLISIWRRGRTVAVIIVP